MDKDKLEAFLKELTELSIKHGMIISSGWEGSYILDEQMIEGTHYACDNNGELFVENSGGPYVKD